MKIIELIRLVKEGYFFSVIEWIIHVMQTHSDGSEKLFQCYIGVIDFETEV
jgi:hypothetical protein